MAVKMLPQDVAEAFVKQYYVILNRSPENLHKFYQELSLLGWPGADGIVTPVTGLSGINDKIMSSDYKSSSAEIKTLDAQESLDGGVIVAVTGSFIDKYNVEKNFNQTFFLAKQEKGFFVLNDILRIFDIQQIKKKSADDSDGMNNHPAPSTTNPEPSSTSDMATSLNTKEVIENENSEEALSVSKDTVAKDDASASIGLDGKACSVVVAPPSNVPPKISYASVVAKESPVTSPRITKVASPTTKVASAPQGDGALKVSTPSSIAVSKPLTSSSKVAPKSAAGNGAPNASVFGEGRGIYIGGLPHDITKQGIVEVVKKFGPVRRNSDTVQIRRHEDGFCCAFVEFESADSARRAVETHYVKFGEKEAYVTYKRSSYNRGYDGGRRSPTRGGFRNNSNFRGREREATHNGRLQNEYSTDHRKGHSWGPRQSRPPSRDRMN